MGGTDRDLDHGCSASTRQRADLSHSWLRTGGTGRGQGTADPVRLRERNDLLAAAGLTPTGAVHSLDSPVLQPVRDVLERVLRQHEPFPAWVIGRGLRFLAANRGAETLFPGVTGMSPEQVIDLWFGAGPYLEQVVNWAEVVRSTLITLRRELLVTGDGEVAALLRRAEELTRDLPIQVPEPGQDGDGLPVACPVLRVNGQLVRTISTVMRFDHATEVTTSELRVELMFPADETSEAALRQQVGGTPEA